MADTPSWLNDSSSEPAPKKKGSKKSSSKPSKSSSRTPSVDESGIRPSSTTSPSSSRAPKTIIDNQGYGEDIPYYTTVKYTFSFLNIVVSACMAGVGVLGMQDAQSADDTGIIFIGLYMLIFAILLFTYEISCLCPCEFLVKFLKSNYGFLYGPFGKGAYMIIICIICFGLDADSKRVKDLAIGTGAAVCFVGCVELILSYLYPKYFPRKSKYDPEDKAWAEKEVNIVGDEE